jgi:hypothetical protein
MSGVARSRLLAVLGAVAERELDALLVQSLRAGCVHPDLEPRLSWLLLVARLARLVRGQRRAGHAN